MGSTAPTRSRFSPEELERRRALARSFEASTIQEGYTPDDEDRDLLRPLIDGEITEAEYFSLLAARDRRVG